MHSPRTSSRAHARERHSSAKSDKSKLENKEAGDRVIIVSKKLPNLPEKRHKNTQSTNLVLFGEKRKSVSVEKHCEKSKVEGVPRKSEEKSFNTKSPHKIPVLGTKKNIDLEALGRKPYRDHKTVKSMLPEEKEQARKGRFSSPSTKADKSSPGRTPGKPRTPHGPPEKKQKLSFEELMNYDIRGIEPS